MYGNCLGALDPATMERGDGKSELLRSPRGAVFQLAFTFAMKVAQMVITITQISLFILRVKQGLLHMAKISQTL